MVFDVSDRSSFESLTRWLSEIFNELALRTDPATEKQGLKPVILVCGNKIDLKQNHCDNAVDDYEAKLWADLHGFTYCEASAMTGTNTKSFLYRQYNLEYDFFFGELV